MPAFLTAGLWGLVAASGLLAGAVVGLLAKPAHRVVAAVMAFGSGTLLSAVAFDLAKEAFHHGGPLTVAVGFLLGGLVFVVADMLIDEKGGFLRREGTRASFLKEKKEERAGDILERLAGIDLIRSLPPAEVQAIVPYVEERTFADGAVVFQKGEKGDALYLVLDGQARVEDDGRVLATLGKGAAFGEMALLTGEPRNATVSAAGELRAYRIRREDFDHLMTRSRGLTDAVHRLLAARLEARRGAGDGAPAADTWLKVASAHLDRSISAREEEAILSKHAGGAHVGLAIFVGALVDGVPESLVVGATVAGGVPKFSFLLAVFLQNFPEAMSSASGMTKAGFSPRRVLGMWSGLIALSAIAALAGNAFLAGASPGALALAESIAGGAILALLANTMMPEAFEMGGRVAAFCTIVGFLVAFLVSAAH